MTVRVIDCETTGTDAAVDAAIEIASVDVLADGTITNKQEALICPPIPVPRLDVHLVLVAKDPSHVFLVLSLVIRDLRDAEQLPEMLTQGFDADLRQELM